MLENNVVNIYKFAFFYLLSCISFHSVISVHLTSYFSFQDTVYVSGSLYVTDLIKEHFGGACSYGIWQRSS